MYLKKLTIETPEKLIRDMEFHSGLNLIIDDTKDISTKTTGNNVGKTTVLKLIDFCLGADSKIIYTDTENKKATYDVVKKFLIDEEVIITLILVEDINDENGQFTGYHKEISIKDYVLIKNDQTKQANIVKEITVEISYMNRKGTQNVQISTYLTKE